METDKLLYAITETAMNGIISIDQRGIIRNINPSVCTTSGYETGEVIGRNILMWMPEPDSSNHDSCLSRYHTTGEAKIAENSGKVWGLEKQGSTFPSRLAGSQTHYGNKTIYAGLVHDLSKKKLTKGLKHILLRWKLQLKMVQGSLGIL